MELRNQFELALPLETVWTGLSDLRLVAECLPGAALGEPLPAGGYAGRLTVKLGPLVAAFNGELTIERDEAARVAVVRAKGADAKTATRVQAVMTYALGAPSSDRTRVEVISDFTLSGALAQFGKAGVMQEVAGQLAAEFARNFAARVAGADAALKPAGAQPDTGQEARPAQLNVVALALRIVWNRIKALFGSGKGGASAG